MYNLLNLSGRGEKNYKKKDDRPKRPKTLEHREVKIKS